MNLSNASRSMLSKIPGLNRAIDFICARANEVWSVQHDPETGTHTTITTTGPITADGAIISGGSGTFDGNVIADADEDPVEIGRLLGTSAGTEGAVGNGLSVRSTPTQTFGFDWLAQNGTFKEVRLQWRTASTNVNPLRIRSEPGTPAYHVMPGPATNILVPCYLGSPTDSFRGGWWAGVYANAFYRNSSTVAEGDWTAVAYAAGNFSASAGTWTVDAGDQLTYKYMLIGKTMWVNFSIVNTDVSNALVSLRIAIPGGFTCATESQTPIRIINAGAPDAVGLAIVAAASTFIECFTGIGGGGFAITAADNTSVIGLACFEVQ